MHNMSKEYYNVDYELKCQGVARGIIRTREKSIFFVFMGIPQKMSALQPAIYIKGVYGGGQCHVYFGF